MWNFVKKPSTFRLDINLEKDNPSKKAQNSSVTCRYIKIFSIVLRQQLKVNAASIQIYFCYILRPSLVRSSATESKCTKLILLIEVRAK